jgi:ABC-type antimicrobial peptide transport system permease subunit
LAVPLVRSVAFPDDGSGELFGLGLAATVGIALGAFWVKVQFQAMLGWRVDLRFPLLFAASAVGLTAVLCLVGSMLPALRAARLAIPVALRDE